MSEHIVRRTEPIVDAQSAMPWLVAVGVYALLTAVGPKLLSDPDTYSHIALGRWILEHGTVPATDPFSATLRGTHWVAFEWLSQVVFAMAHAAAGWTGVVAVTAVAMATALGLLSRFLQREWQPTAVLVAVLCAILLTAPHILARPHILALPVTVAWIALLIRAVDTRSSPPWLLLPLMTLWANLHGSFTFGLAMIAPIACDALWRAPQILRHDRALSLQNLPDFLRLLDDYSIRATLLAPSTPAVALLDRLPDWRRAYADEIAVVHTRR
jgi:hypothetical protein